MMWTDTLAELCREDRCSAAAFLALMEAEDDEAFESAVEYLVENDVVPDLSDLPRPENTGPSAPRLRREEQLSKSGELISALEETDPLRLYLQEISDAPREDVEVLAKRCVEGDLRTPEKLANSMLADVADIAREYTGRGVLLSDLCQEGGLALWQAILSYREGDFRDGCIRRIRQAMAIAAMTQARSAGIGQKLRRGMEDYRDMDQQLLSELGRNPTEEEIAQRLHISREEADALRRALESAQLRRRVDEARTLGQSTPEDQQAVENTAYFQSRQRVLELISSLSEQDAWLLSLRFGLEGQPPLTPEEAGERLGITAQQVIERETAALAALRGEHTNG